MNVLISVSTLMTFGYSLVITAFSIIAPYIMGLAHDANPPPPYFEAPCMIITFLLVGKCLEGYAKQSTADSLNELLGSQPLTANLLDGTKVTSIPVELVQIGDKVQVFPGDAVPVDGVMVSDGEAGFDEALLTGESRAVAKQKGDVVIGGSRCLTGRVVMEVQRVGSGTMLNQISSLVEKAQSNRAPVQTVADNICAWFIPCVLALSVATAFVWYLIVFVFQLQTIKDISPAGTNWPILEMSLYVMQYGLTTLLVACPCALGLATPTAVMTATGSAAKYGILLKNGGLALENGSKITHMVLDKTGTITEGKPKVHRASAIGLQTEAKAWSTIKEAYLAAMKGKAPVAPCESVVALETSEGEADATTTAALWWAIGCAEISSEHPLAKVLVDAARIEARGELVEPSNFENIKGKGVKCSLSGMQMHVGSVKAVLDEAHAGFDKAPLEAWATKCREEGATVIALAINGTPLGAVALRDQVAPYAKQCIAKIQEEGIEVWMCTGDHATTAGVIAKEVGIQKWKIVAEALPADKVKTVEKLQKENKEQRNIVAMVGDGINDSPALATADVGLAIGAGHNVTVDAADAVLIRSDFRDLVTFLQLSKAGLATIWRNFFWAFLFNMTAIPVAMGCLVPVGIKFTPYLAVGAMAFSSLFVVNCSLHLRNFVPEH
jgi:Cu+-exporting ATPase